MDIRKAVLPMLAAGVLLGGLVANPLYADDDDRGERNGRHERSEKGESRGGGRLINPADNLTYKQECSSCHFLYLPGLLPARSWQEIMKGSDKHFGENLALDAKVKEEITNYLTANSAEKQDNRRSRKIMASINGTPAKITDVPYIKKEHRKISAEVFKRPSIGSPSNCGACHPRAAQGDFEEDSVSIPKK